MARFSVRKCGRNTSLYTYAINASVGKGVPMPSNSLLEWQNNRLSRLNFVDDQNIALAAATPPNPQLIDENLRGYVMLISAHFQGFCRDLHTECVQAVANAVPPPMLLIFQTLCGRDLELDGANAKYASIKTDFERFGFDLTVALRADQKVAKINDGLVTRIGHLNAWRNYAAHHNKLPPDHGGPFTLATIQAWKNSCSDLAIVLDGLMYNQLRVITGVSPW